MGQSLMAETSDKEAQSIVTTLEFIILSTMSSFVTTKNCKRTETSTWSWVKKKKKGKKYIPDLQGISEGVDNGRF